jgi:hypothetical protein
MLALRCGFSNVPSTTRSTLRPSSATSSIFELEICVKGVQWRAALELDDEIQVAASGVEIAARGRAEQVEPVHVETAAECPQFLAMPRDFFYHGRGPGTAPQA